MGTYIQVDCASNPETRSEPGDHARGPGLAGAILAHGGWAADPPGGMGPSGAIRPRSWKGPPGAHGARGLYWPGAGLDLDPSSQH